MAERIEMNPGEMFMVADRTILVSEYESVLGQVSKIGVDEDRIAYFFTFWGRVNKSDEVTEVTVAMSPHDSFELTNDILNGLELLNKLQSEERGD